MKRLKFIAIPLMALSLAACDTGAGPKQSFGTLGGAALGGLAGSQIGGGKGQLWATGAGVLLGALLGSEVGKSLDRADRTYMQQTTTTSLENGRSGVPATWRNPDSGNSGTIIPQPAYQTNDGQYCREYQQTVVVGGQSQKAYGTACRQQDGSWKIING